MKFTSEHNLWLSPRGHPKRPHPPESGYLASRRAQGWLRKPLDSTPKAGAIIAHGEAPRRGGSKVLVNLALIGGPSGERLGALTPRPKPQWNNTGCLGVARALRSSESMLFWSFSPGLGSHSDPPDELVQVLLSCCLDSFCGRGRRLEATQLFGVPL